MNTETSSSNNVNTESPGSQGFPKAILSVTRQQFGAGEDGSLPLTLTIHKGRTQETTQLSADLTGAVFVVAPAGNVASTKLDDFTVLPAKDGWTSLLNGDGLVYRLEFQQGKAELTSRFVQTPSYYADRISNTSYPQLKFRNFGLSRLTPILGICNEVNTAFLPMQFTNQKQRLLVTWDVGYPFEVDPKSLKVIAPVGLNFDWQEFLKLPFTVPFRQVMTSAHPSFDAKTGEMFSTNVVKSLGTLLWISRLFAFDLQKFLGWLSQIYLLKILIAFLTGLFVAFFQLLEEILEYFGIGSGDRLYLMRWDGSGAVQKWQVVHPNGRAVKIRQTMHQMGITEKYVVLADTAFKIVLSDLIPSFNDRVLKLQEKYQTANFLESEIEEKTTADIAELLEFLRNNLDFPQSPDTSFCIIDRAQLQQVSPGQSIVAKSFSVQGEITHFLVDYKNPDGKIGLHAALNKATDPAEFLRNVDISVFKDSPEISDSLKELAGMFNNGMAVNRPAFYTINGDTAKVEKAEILCLKESKQHTWSLGLYAYRDDMPTQQFDDIYWSGFGAWEDMLSDFYFEMYKQYKYQDLSLAVILTVVREGVPVSINRLHINREAKVRESVLEIADNYEFPQGYFASSPQFVPRPDSTASTDGYIVCIVIHSDRLLPTVTENSEQDWSDNSEIWIFDAANLCQGPLYTMSHPLLNFGFTLHSTWMKDPTTVASRPYDVRADFADLVAAAMKVHKPEIQVQMQQLFEQVYTDFERDRHH